MGVEDHQNQISYLCQIAYDFLIVVSAIPFGDTVEHSRGVNDGKSF